MPLNKEAVNKNYGAFSPHNIHFCCCGIAAQSCLLLCDLTDCSPPGLCVHGISQARILEWVAISCSRGSSWPTDRTYISCIGRRVLYYWATWILKVICSHSKNLEQPIWCSHQWCRRETLSLHPYSVFCLSLSPRCTVMLHYVVWHLLGFVYRSLSLTLLSSAGYLPTGRCAYFHSFLFSFTHTHTHNLFRTFKKGVFFKPQL